MQEFHLCLSDLLDQDLTAYEYFQSLPPSFQQLLRGCEVCTFSELQDRARALMQIRQAEQF